MTTIEKLDQKFPREVIDGGGRCGYLFRWILIRFWKWIPVKAAYLHCFHGSDWSNHLHDHPTWFLTIGLKGYYIEITDDVDNPCGSYSMDGDIFIGPATARIRRYTAPWIRFFRQNTGIEFMSLSLRAGLW